MIYEECNLDIYESNIKYMMHKLNICQSNLEIILNDLDIYFTQP